MKICPKCGTEVERRFCPDCGTEVLEPTTIDIAKPMDEVIDPEDVGEPAVEAVIEPIVEEKKVKAEPEVMTLQHYAGEEQYNNQKTVDEKIEELEGSMSAKTTGIVAYITWVGFIIALVLGDRKGAMFHINQSLVINLAAIIVNFVAIIPILGWIVSVVGSIFCFVCWCMGLYYACTDQKKEVPLLGQIKLLS